MNKKQFHNLLLNAENYKGVSIQALKELINDFPYSALVQSFYLKKLLLEEDYRFEEELFKTALLVPDRSALKKFLFDNDRTAATLESSETIQPAKLRAIHDESDPSLLEEKKSHKKEGKQASAPELEKELIAQAINASISIEVATPLEHEETTKKTKEAQSHTHKIPAEEVRDENQKRSFSDWIKSFQEEFKEKQTQQENFRKNAEALIDQFIKSQPKIVAKKEFYSAENRAKKSIEEPEDLATETLAKIYATQGKVQKAIQTYERLILKFPEKKAYFAGQINQLKNS